MVEEMGYSKRLLDSMPDEDAEVFAPSSIAPIGKPRITNIFNLPEPLVQAVMNDKYSSGSSDYTTSQLAGTPARQWALKRRHWRDVTEDVSDRIYSLSGQSKHVVLERAAEFCEQYQYLAEERFFAKRCGKTISGQIDLYDKNQGILYDWKETSVYVSYLSLKAEWIAQGNINRVLMEENGYPVNEIVNIALYRDWKKSLVGSTEKYPEHQVAKFEIPLWAIEETEAFIERRIGEFEGAKRELPLCSDEERWKKPDVYAVHKLGQKRAINGGLFRSAEEAKTHLEMFNLGATHGIEFRAGENKRCQSYCLAMPFCSQAKELGVTKETEAA